MKFQILQKNFRILIDPNSFFLCTPRDQRSKTCLENVSRLNQK